jgi:flagellar basal body P-ring formation protein FlgA
MKRVTKTVLLALLCCGAGAPPPGKTPAELKLDVQLDAAVITVGDLWADAGAKADTVIGPAPQPGQTIAVEAPQLAYIAHLYDVNWRPVSGVERAVIERAGRPLQYDEITVPIRRSLVQEGAPDGASVELAAVPPIMVPPQSMPRVTVEADSYDAGSTRFSADLAVSTAGMQTQRVRVTGRIAAMIKAVIALHRLEPGEVITKDDVQEGEVAQHRLSSPVEHDVAEVVGQTPRRTIVAGQAVQAGDLGAPIVVTKGAPVELVLQTATMSLTAQGVAMGAGGRGDVIQVLNPTSRAILAARVTGPGQVAIAPGSTPIVPPAHAMQSNPEVTN